MAMYPWTPGNDFPCGDRQCPLCYGQRTGFSFEYRDTEAETRDQEKRERAEEIQLAERKRAEGQTARAEVLDDLLAAHDEVEVAVMIRQVINER